MAQNSSGCGPAALIVLGLVILIPSGLCTGIVALLPLASAVGHPRDAAMLLSALPVALIFGGPFIIGGAALIWTGIAASRRASRDAQSRDDGRPPL
jgi:hypothetical protein